MNLQKCINQSHDLYCALTNLQSAGMLELPSPDITLRQAVTELLLVAGKEYATIDFKVICYNAKSEVEIEIYDGANHYKAKSLQGAVALMKADNQEPEADGGIEAAQDLIDEHKHAVATAQENAGN